MISQVVGTIGPTFGSKNYSNHQEVTNGSLVVDPIVFSHTQGLDAQPSEVASPTLRVEGSGMATLTEMTVRRLTPTECERLMGWPDNHTLHRADNKNNSDTTRYKMCGNGVASPVAAWLAHHINQAEQGINQ